MKTKKFGIVAIVLLLAFFLTPVRLLAEDLRTVPLDLYLIIDASEGFREARDETVAWINDQVIDRLLRNGDRLIIWSAGKTATVILTETVGAEKSAIREKIQSLVISGTDADFSGALRDAAAQASQRNPDGARISYTMLVSGSAENLAPALENSVGLFRWFRAEKYARWQALVVDPNILQKVRAAAASYMAGI